VHPIVALTTGVACSFACHANVLLSGIASWQKHNKMYKYWPWLGCIDFYLYDVFKMKFQDSAS